MPSRNRLAGRVHAVSCASQDRRSALDWLRNGLGATAVSCARAGVSFTVTTIRTRLEADENRPVAWFTDLAQKLPEFKAPRPPGRGCQARSAAQIIDHLRSSAETAGVNPIRPALGARPVCSHLLDRPSPPRRRPPPPASVFTEAVSLADLPGPRQLAAAYLLIAGMRRIGHCGRCAHPSLLEEDKETDLKRGARPDRHDPAANAYG